jgi:DNA-3-methyladenine glycosylase II
LIIDHFIMPAIDPSLPPAPPVDWSAAEKFLKRDPVLKEIIHRVGPCTLTPRPDPFLSLVRAIVGQQISVAAAASVYARYKALFPNGQPTPEAGTTFTDAQLRSAGLSRQKAGYLRDLAIHMADGRVPHHTFSALDDEAIITILTDIRGIGRWTAEMFLIFTLNRPDVLPVDDLGLQKNARLAYGLRKNPSRDRLLKLAKPWRPWRSIATWYLWRSTYTF